MIFAIDVNFIKISLIVKSLNNCFPEKVEFGDFSAKPTDSLIMLIFTLTMYWLVVFGSLLLVRILLK